VVVVVIVAVAVRRSEIFLRGRDWLTLKIYIYIYSWFFKICIKNHEKNSQPTSGQVTGEIITNIKRKKSKYS